MEAWVRSYVQALPKQEAECVIQFCSSIIRSGILHTTQTAETARQLEGVRCEALRLEAIQREELRQQRDVQALANEAIAEFGRRDLKRKREINEPLRAFLAEKAVEDMSKEEGVSAQKALNAYKAYLAAHRYNLRDYPFDYGIIADVNPNWVKGTIVRCTACKQKHYIGCCAASSKNTRNASPLFIRYMDLL